MIQYTLITIVVLNLLCHTSKTATLRLLGDVKKTTYNLLEFNFSKYYPISSVELNRKKGNQLNTFIPF